MEPAAQPERREIASGRDRERPGQGESRRRRTGSVEDGTAGPRTKRTKYAAAACDTCKKRKIKCHVDVNATRCRRCQDQDIECIYSNSDGPFQVPNSHVSATSSETVEGRLLRLENRLGALQSDFERHCVEGTQAGTPHGVLSDGTRHTSQTIAKHHQPQFLGPTRPAFALNIARASLQGGGTVDDPAFSSPPSPQLSAHDVGTPNIGCTSDAAYDPLRTTPKARVLQLLHVYEEEVHPVHPIFDAPALISQTEENFDAWLVSQNPITDPSELDVSLLRVVVAIGECVNSLGPNDFCRQLISSAEAEASKSYTNSVLTCRDAVVLTTLSIYYFHADQELLAWRRIGTAARVVLELGLHRKESTKKNIPDDRRRVWAVRLFWCIYILDRRWSIGLSLPFTLQDADIDPEILQPDNDVSYLRCMVQYGKICSNLWQSYPALGSSAKTFSKETVSYLEFQIESWAKSIPKNLQLETASTLQDDFGSSKTMQRLRILLHLRKNHLRLLINYQCVLSIDSVQKDLEAAQTLVETAKNSISVLVRLNSEGTMYTRQQAAFNHFLMTALAIVFLAVCHAPSEFGHQCRPTFDSAIMLVRTSAAHGSNSHRLWKSIQVLLPQAQDLYASLRPPDDMRTAQTTSVRRSSEHPNPVHDQRREDSRSLTNGPQGSFDFDKPHAPTESLHGAPGSNLDSTGPGPYDSANAWGASAAGPPPAQDITQITDDLTELYQSFETSNFDNDLFNFTAESGDFLLDDTELTRLFQGQIAGL